VLRCVDGEKNGALPKCPKCSKKTLKPNDTATEFVCPGYYDESRGGFIKCGYSGTNHPTLKERAMDVGLCTGVPSCVCVARRASVILQKGPASCVA
jgi:hypothetical protein